jgi:hypothetical protein
MPNNFFQATPETLCGSFRIQGAGAAEEKR